MTVADASAIQVVEPAALEDVGALVEAARRVQATWGATPVHERAALFGRTADVLLERSDEIADVVVAETGKPRVEVFTTELFPALDALAWLAQHARKVLAPERLPFRRLHLLQKSGRLVYEPLGVVGVISPWNFPFSIPFTQVAYALAAGNAVVLKPSELTPSSGALVTDVFAAAGLPAGLVQLAQGAGEVGAALVRAGVDKVVFTGSAEVGREVAAAAGERLVPVTLELGGKDPMLVLEDADLSRAVAGALWGSFVNAGQVCSGVERIVVEGSLYAPFTEELARRTRELRLGEEVGPLISEEQRDRVAALVDDAVQRGATVLAGGTTPERAGWFYEPTVLAGVDAAARIRSEEISALS